MRPDHAGVPCRDALLGRASSTAPESLKVEGWSINTKYACHDGETMTVTTPQIAPDCACSPRDGVLMPTLLMPTHCASWLRECSLMAC